MLKTNNNFYFIY
jgi:serine/threonine protein kinase